MRKKGKFFIMMLALLSSLSLSGCAGKAVSLTSPTQVMSDVCERNIQVLKTFLNQGLISEAQFKHYESALRERATTYSALITKAKDATSEDDKNFKATLSMLQGSLVHRIGEEKGDGTFYGGIGYGGSCPDSDSYYYLSDSTKEVDKDEFINLVIGSDKTRMDGKGEAASPLVFIDENNLDSLLKEINRQVYILDETKLKSEEDWSACIEAIYNVKNSDTNDENYKHLKEVVIKYFKPTNKTVYNFTKDDIIRVSEDNSENLGKTSDSNELNKDVIINGLMKVSKHEHTQDKDGNPVCDIEEGTESVGVYSLRVQEFDADFYQKVNGEGYTNNKYITLQPIEGDDLGVALLMEYPVSVIDSLEADSENSSNWYFNYNKTDIKVNIFNGQMLIKNENGSNQIINIEDDEADKLYRVMPANVGKDIEIGKKTSFTPIVSSIAEDEIIMLDEDEENATLTNTEPELISTVGFLLKDYLELTYMPGVINEEDFIATGRKISIYKFSGNQDEDIGYFTDRIGDEFVNSQGEAISIKVSDIIDYSSGFGYYYKDVGIGLKFSGHKNASDIEEELSKSEEERVGYLKSLLEPEENLNDTGLVADKNVLPYKAYLQIIKPVLKFTSAGDDTTPSLDKQDVENDKLQPASYYGLCINTNLFNTGLYTTWINPNNLGDIKIDVVGHGNKGGSLSWWNNWLSLHQYTYNININTLIRKMNGIYSVTLAELDDTIVFDAETLRVINQEIQQEKEEETKSLVRTIQTLIGALFLIYGLIMIACWLIDVNLVNGPGFLTIITGGKFVSIRDASELPRLADNHIYVDFKYLAVLMIIFMALGIMLIVFDIQDISTVVYRLIESLVKLIENLMLNK